MLTEGIWQIAEGLVEFQANLGSIEEMWKKRLTMWSVTVKKLK